MKLTHVDKKGKTKMVDVSGKPRIKRTAIAKGKIRLQPATIKQLKQGLLKKGDALSVAKIAGIMGAKKTSELIPLCHNIEIDHVDLQFTMVKDGVVIEAKAACMDKTGIEMEALTAVSIAALTIYDMCKAVDKKMEIGEIRLIKKTKDTTS
jgi:cyclic pyranopterin phosphate synthase